jgi:hypothetical protein
MFGDYFSSNYHLEWAIFVSDNTDYYISLNWQMFNSPAREIYTKIQNILEIVVPRPQATSATIFYSISWPCIQISNIFYSC